MNFIHTVKQAASIITLSLVIIAPAFALDLGDAKSQGLVGETSSGYISAVIPSQEVKALVERINSQRKAHYEKIAK
ncbi:MAG: DUF1318 domain-containing protein, partial [Halioglobus sp.]